MPEPAWARWSTAGAERPWTLGIEEVMLLDRDRWGVANLADELVAQLPPELAGSGLETHACVLELGTAAHGSVAAAGAELARLRRRVAALLGRRLGLAAAAAGTHPLVTRADVEVSAGARYRGIEEATRVLSRREPTMALHVHVAVPTADGAIRALDGLRGDLPLLLALSANSPFWRGEDTGFASIRTPIFSMFRRTGIPRQYGTYEHYVAAVDPLLRSARCRMPATSGGTRGRGRISARWRCGSWTRSRACSTRPRSPRSSGAWCGRTPSARHRACPTRWSPRTGSVPPATGCARRSSPPTAARRGPRGSCCGGAWTSWRRSPTSWAACPS